VESKGQFFKCLPSNAIADGRLIVNCSITLSHLLLMFLSNRQLLAACITLHQQLHASQCLTNGEIDRECFSTGLFRNLGFIQLQKKQRKIFLGSVKIVFILITSLPDCSFIMFNACGCTDFPRSADEVTIEAYFF
jgi:hypothetical protein